MPDHVDEHLGRRLRNRRRMMELTQADVARTCGIGAQRIHKYESAANAMSAAMVWKFATVLGVDIRYFYEGLSPETEAGPAE
jgi:transcriptional regulator with XRE-family HTH domain